MWNTLLLIGLMLTASVARAQTVVQLVHDIDTGFGGSGPQALTVYNSNLYFVANDGDHGSELWKYTGSGAPTMVADLNPGAGHGAQASASGAPMAVYNGKLYFPVRDGNNYCSMYEYNGVSAPTHAPHISANASPSYMTVYGSKLYYVSDALHEYDGVNPPVKYPTNTGTAYNYAYELTPFKGKIVFCGRNGNVGDELYEFDTSTKTVSLVQDINPGSIPSNPSALTVVNGKLYFTAQNNSTGTELYSYDGTTVTRLTDMSVGAVWSLRNGRTQMGVYNNDLYFTATNNGIKYNLYRWETATSDTTLVYKFDASSSSNRVPVYFANYNGRLYFAAGDNYDTLGLELWRTDGTITERAADICQGYCEGKPNNFRVYNNYLYFGGQRQNIGMELFRYQDSASAALSVPRAFVGGDVQVYPNPTHIDATMQLSLAAPETLSIILTDLNGRTVWKKEATRYEGLTRIAIPTSTLSAGMYFYRVQSAKGTQLSAGKLLVE